jgi:SUN domain-containing protein 1/2
MQPNNPNSSWASGRPAVQAVPRSTSVEYEREAAARRQAALALPKPNSRRKPLSKTTSMRLVPDSEGEDGPETANGRAKSPFEHVIDMTRRALSPATFYLRQRSHEPENLQRQANGDESSYDYAAEEAEYQSIINQGPHSRRGATTAHKRNRMSLDNKAYRPTASDLEDEDEDFDDPGGKLRRRKKKKEPLGGPLTTLPSVANFEKKKRRRPRGSKGNLGEMDDDERSDSDDNAEDHVQVRSLLFPCSPRLRSGSRL